MLISLFYCILHKFALQLIFYMMAEDDTRYLFIFLLQFFHIYFWLYRAWEHDSNVRCRSTKTSLFEFVLLLDLFVIHQVVTPHKSLEL